MSSSSLAMLVWMLVFTAAVIGFGAYLEHKSRLQDNALRELAQRDDDLVDSVELLGATAGRQESSIRMLEEQFTAEDELDLLAAGDLTIQFDSLSDLGLEEVSE